MDFMNIKLGSVFLLESSSLYGNDLLLVISINSRAIKEHLNLHDVLYRVQKLSRNADGLYYISGETYLEWGSELVSYPFITIVDDVYGVSFDIEF